MLILSVAVKRVFIMEVQGGLRSHHLLPTPLQSEDTDSSTHIAKLNIKISLALIEFCEVKIELLKKYQHF